MTSYYKTIRYHINNIINNKKVKVTKIRGKNIVLSKKDHLFVHLPS
jgi:uncharacterized ubiquitin-like protein YukD